MADGSTKRCSTCSGSGKDVCWECEGLGEIECECGDCGHVHDAECPTCEGTGGEGTCRECDGAGRVPKTDADLESEGQLNLLQETT